MIVLNDLEIMKERTKNFEVKRGINKFTFKNFPV